MTVIQPATPADVDELLALRVANRAYFERWEPDADEPDSRYELAYVREWATREHHFVILDEGAVAGFGALHFVELGAMQSSMVGYSVGEASAGKGLATRAVAELLDYAFGTVGLHRVEAGTHVDNVASQRVLERNGFTLVGTLRRHLRIGGVWHDHLLWEILADDPR